MKNLKIRKFFLDYLVGSILIVGLVFVLIGNFTVMDTKGVLTIVEGCSAYQSSEDILNSAMLVLRNNERCEFIQPCDGFQRLSCEGTAKVSEIPAQFFAQDLLVFRVKKQLQDRYKFAAYSDRSTYRIPIGLVSFLFVYLAVLIEASALLFALWRQRELRQTFSLSPGSEMDQLMSPLLIGALLAACIIMLNFLVSRLFEYPDAEQLQSKLAYLQTGAGMLMAVLVAPFVEELVFRGVLLRLFVERNKRLLGVVVVSVGFAAVHALWEQYLGWQLFRFLLYFMVSVVLCWSYIKHKNLWPPMILHGGYNAMMVGFLNVFG